MIPSIVNTARQNEPGNADGEVGPEGSTMNRRAHQPVPRASQPASNGPDGTAFRRRKTDRLAAEGHLKSRVVKRSIVVAGHKTSVSLEDVFWHELRAIAQNRGLHLSQLVGSIDAERQYGNLSSAIRLFVFEHSRSNHADDAIAHPDDGRAPV
jgi:predicted DNA-binding ribbon-helix-helix protein